MLVGLRGDWDAKAGERGLFTTVRLCERGSLASTRGVDA